MKYLLVYPPNFSPFIVLNNVNICGLFLHKLKNVLLLKPSLWESNNNSNFIFFILLFINWLTKLKSFSVKGEIFNFNSFIISFLLLFSSSKYFIILFCWFNNYIILSISDLLSLFSSFNSNFTSLIILIVVGIIKTFLLFSIINELFPWAIKSTNSSNISSKVKQIIEVMI